VSLGYIDGKTFRLDFRFAEGDPARLPELARALVCDEPSVIVASGDAAIRAAQTATHTIPIEVRKPAEIPAAVESLRDGAVEGVNIMSSPAIACNPAVPLIAGSFSTPIRRADGRISFRISSRSERQ